MPVIRPELPEKAPEKQENETETLSKSEKLLNETEALVKEPANRTQVPSFETDKPEESPAGLPETPATEKESEKIAPEIEEKPREARNECVLATDCGGPQDVCSNGNCVTLPIPVEKVALTEKGEKEEPKTPSENPQDAAKKEEKPSKETGIPSEPEKQQETPEQPQGPPAEESTPTGSMMASFANFVRERLTGMAVREEKSCEGECKPCEECNRNVDNFMKKIRAGEVLGPGGCKNRMECEGYCQKEEHKEECESFFKSQGLETFDCWQEFCRECDKCKFKEGEFRCNANQQFNMEEGFCKCNEGWNDCDGDWENGCESSQQCGGCQTKDDCAKDRCAPWGNVIQQFDCFKGEEWVEEKGVLRLEGQCRFYPTKKMESHLGFDMWGEPFEALYPIQEQAQREMGWEWCGWELENNIRERAEIQNSFTGDSLKWFFEEYVPSSPGEWEKHIGGIFDSYWRIVNNDEWTAQNLLCLGRDKWPEEYKPIDVSYDTDFGSVRMWEVETTTDYFGKRMKIFSPYMQIWVFPTKEFIKKEFQNAMEEGLMPGPEGKQKPELSPSEIEELKKDKKLMEAVNSVSKKYGGEAKFLIDVVEGEELVFRAQITINPDVIIKLEPTGMYEGDYDAKFTIDFDFFYSLIRAGEKDMRGGQTEYPPWEKEGLKLGDTIKGAVDGVRMWLRINSGIRGGSIKAEPPESLSDGLTIMQLMFERGGGA